MLSYVVLPTNTRAMPLSVSSEEYTEEWRACWSDPQRDLLALYEMSEPWLDHWVNLITDPMYPKDLNYISLCARLSIESPGNALTKIKEWQSSITCDLKEELTMLLFVHVRTANYYPKFCRSPHIAEFVIARGFNYALQKEIDKIERSPKIDYVDNRVIFDLQSVNDNEIDWLLLSNLGLSNWESYIFDMVRNGQTINEISKYCHIPRETFYYEEKEIWKKTRTLLQESDV